MMSREELKDGYPTFKIDRIMSWEGGKWIGILQKKNISRFVHNLQRDMETIKIALAEKTDCKYVNFP